MKHHNHKHEQETSGGLAVIDLTEQARMSSASPAKRKNASNGIHSCGEDKHWLSISGLRLTESDKHILLQGQWLNDKHIHAGQLLMKNDSSLLPVGSLQDNFLGQNMHFEVATDKSVQILHSQYHWHTISTIGTSHPTVRVYDSLHQSLAHSIRMQVAALLHV